MRGGGEKRRRGSNSRPQRLHRHRRTQETPPQETPPQETPPQETAPQKTPPQEIPPQETAPRRARRRRGHRPSLWISSHPRPLRRARVTGAHHRLAHRPCPCPLRRSPTIARPISRRPPAPSRRRAPSITEGRRGSRLRGARLDGNALSARTPTLSGCQVASSVESRGGRFRPTGFRARLRTGWDRWACAPRWKFRARRFRTRKFRARWDRWACAPR